MVRVPAGHSVAFYLAVGRVSVANVDGELMVDSHAAPVTATGAKGDLNVDVGSGDVRITGGEGTLNVDTGSGSVEVSALPRRRAVDRHRLRAGDGERAERPLDPRWTPAPATSS